MKITKIEEQKKAKNRVNIYIDNEFAFGISSLLLVDYDLYKGKEISSSEIEKYKEGDNLSKCLTRAYRFLSFRPRSEKEMREKLLEKYDEETVKKSIKKLKNLNYVNDEEFARMWINSRRSGRSKKALEFELKKKGVDAELINKSLSNLNKDDEVDAALKLVQSRRKYQGLSGNEAYQKIGGFLSRRGYSYEIIKEVIKKISGL